MKILKSLILAAVCSSFLSITSFADEFGTKEEAATLLERAVAIVRIDKNRALDLFTRLEGGLALKDLYVFCASANGTIIAHPSIIGVNIYDGDLLDVEGTPFGEAFFSAAKAGEIGEVTYQYTRPTTDSEQEYTKTSLVTRVAGIVCGVGYYHQE
ncbi:MAG: cache domain-containing protein [Alphaproteobacteria bacterium]|jgi:hypothetical protein|nr:chemotaxis protein [Rhodospirillaceae bacterium]MDP6238689.1 cache domain-containing protein [Alphaproteobacteria bacterium]MDP7173951.1 cache domain-containing protein [Alphaproteobacteria bacterium]MDP7233329.1 cache domain-containing protein [Alphaproteobacteria bacterium]MDP7488473.1 cache domain-containing protein [Alphaproteobacteria bacterium]